MIAFIQRHKKLFVLPLVGLLATFAGASTSIVGCGPFTDTSGAFCPFILTVYYLGVAAGTSPTTYDPTANVTRGQMAVFLAAMHNQIKRNENPNRVANRNNHNLINFDYQDFASPNTTSPNGFCSDQYYTYVANQANNKIDLYVKGAGYQFVSSITTTTANNRLACDGSFLWATSVYGTTIKRINLHTGVVQDPWITLPVSGAGDIATAGYGLAVTTNNGVVILDNAGGIGPGGNVNLGGPGFGVVVDNNLNFWVNTSSQLKKIAGNGTVLQTVNLSASSLNAYYPVFDGSSIWVPLDANGIDIVSTNGTIIDHRPISDGGAGTSGLQGLGFNGRNVYAGFIGDYGCGAGSGSLLVAYDAASHQPLQGAFEPCNTLPYTIGFDGVSMHVLGYSNGTHFIQ